MKVGCSVCMFFLVLFVGVLVCTSSSFLGLVFFPPEIDFMSGDHLHTGKGRTKYNLLGSFDDMNHFGLVTSQLD